MSRIWLQALLVSGIAVTAAHAMSYAARRFVDRPADNVTLLLLTLLPVAISVPIALFVFRQNEKLNRAHAALLAANEALARKASRDQMTGLLNRESFLEQIDVLRLMPRGGALLIIDVDHFKNINDRFGHPVGDEALVSIASAIAGSIRGEDIVGRIGGEEFGVFLMGADLHEAMRVAQRIRGAVEAVRFVADGQKVALTVSVGGAIAKPRARLGELIRCADARLYEAKRNGRNRAVIEAGLSAVA